jgi:GGDEF domain-containing protein
VGFARYPEDGTDAETLIAVADQRMYRNKRVMKGLPLTPPPRGIDSGKAMPDAAALASRK